MIEARGTGSFVFRSASRLRARLRCGWTERSKDCLVIERLCDGAVLFELPVSALELGVYERGVLLLRLRAGGHFGSLAGGDERMAPLFVTLRHRDRARQAADFVRRHLASLGRDAPNIEEARAANREVHAELDALAKERRRHRTTQAAVALLWALVVLSYTWPPLVAPAVCLVALLLPGVVSGRLRARAERLEAVRTKVIQAKESVRLNLSGPLADSVGGLGFAPEDRDSNEGGLALSPEPGELALVEENEG